MDAFFRHHEDDFNPEGYPADPTPADAEAMTEGLPDGPAPGAARNYLLRDCTFPAGTPVEEIREQLEAATSAPVFDGAVLDAYVPLPTVPEPRAAEHAVIVDRILGDVHRQALYDHDPAYRWLVRATALREMGLL